MEPLDTAGMIKDVLRDVEAALPTATWIVQTQGVPEGAHVRTGDSPDGWRFVVGASPDPEGRLHYDGAANRGHIVIRLPPELAVRAWNLAEKA